MFINHGDIEGFAKAVAGPLIQRCISFFPLAARLIWLKA